MAIVQVARRHAVAAVIAVVAGAGQTELSQAAYVELLGDEGMVLKPYFDIAGVKTICVGETIEIEDRIYTKEECAALFVKRANQVHKQVKRCTRPSLWQALPQPTKEAFVSFTYNLGSGAFCNGSVAKNINRGRAIKACGRMRLYNKARDPDTNKLRYSRGLADRREKEARKCESGFA